MAAAPLSIKLRCQGWEQLQRLHERDLSRGTLFLKSAKPPPIGTELRVDLTIPSGTTIALDGRVARHVPPGDRGPGVDVLLAKIAASDMWVIESALATAGFPPKKALAVAPAAAAAAPAAAPKKAPPQDFIDLEGGPHQTPAPLPPPPPAPPPRGAAKPAAAAAPPAAAAAAAPAAAKPASRPAPPPRAPAPAPEPASIEIHVEVDVTEEPAAAAAEFDLVEALEAELAALRHLNPFQVLGVPYDTTDDAVRAAFNELTKKYHPDRFARYESERARALAGEIFILVREASRKISDSAARTTSRAALQRGQTPPGTPVRGVPVPSPASSPGTSPPPPPAAAMARGAPPLPAPPPPAAADPKKVVSFRQSGQQAAVNPPGPGSALSSDALFGDVDNVGPPGISIPAAAPAASAGNLIARGDQLLEAGRYEEAASAFEAALRSRPSDRVARVGKELARGFAKLAEGDRISAAQCFEAALEIDPMNERAARELSAMRRAATDQRRGLLGKLLGKT